MRTFLIGFIVSLLRKNLWKMNRRNFFSLPQMTLLLSFVIIVIDVVVAVVLAGV